jgi:hypothetical protein
MADLGFLAVVAVVVVIASLLLGIWVICMRELPSWLRFSGFVLVVAAAIVVGLLLNVESTGQAFGNSRATSGDRELAIGVLANMAIGTFVFVALVVVGSGIENTRYRARQDQ